MRILLLATILITLLTGCGSSQVDERGIQVSLEKLQNIASGLTVTGGGSLRNGWAVKSDNFQNIYFIAAEIDGPGIEGSGEIGVWASNTLEANQGIILAISPLAIEFSNWIDGNKTASQISMYDDGASEARRCVENSQ